MTRIDSSSDAMDIVKEMHGAIKAIVDEFDNSSHGEDRQISAQKALTDLKKIRTKQRKF